MKAIRNTTHAPLRVPLGSGRVLHLGPGQSGSVADDAPQAPAMARMIKARKLEIVGTEDASVETVAAGGTPREHAQGHGHPSHVFPKGNRGG
jgi:hypothetical protein